MFVRAEPDFRAVQQQTEMQTIFMLRTAMQITCAKKMKHFNVYDRQSKRDSL